MCMTTKYNTTRVTETNLHVPRHLGVTLPATPGTQALDDKELLVIKGYRKKSPPLHKKK